MPVTPSKRYRGTAVNATWTKTFPTAGSAIPLDGIESFRFDAGISVKETAADGDLFMTACFNDMNNPTVAFETIDPYAVAAITADQRGTLAFSVADSANGLTTGGGGRSYAILNTYLKGSNKDHAFREFGKESISFGMISADGITSPITLSSL